MIELSKLGWRVGGGNAGTIGISRKKYKGERRMKNSKNFQVARSRGGEKVFCKKCCLAMALAEPTTASGDTHFHCAVMEAARDFVKVGMQLCPSANPGELQKQLYKLLKAAISEQSETAGEKAAIIQAVATSLFGAPIELSVIIADARA